MKKLSKFITLLLAITIVLSACSSNKTDNGEDKTPIQSPIQEEQPANEDEPTEPVNPEETPAEAVNPADLPKTKELEFPLEGMTEKANATLTLSEQGYAFYLMEGFEFSME